MAGGTTIVEVLDAPTLVNAQDATQGHAFDTRQIDLLPSADREPIALLSLQPGVVCVGNQVNDGVDSRGGSVAGARSDQTNVTIDGIDDNDQVWGSAFSGALRATLDSLQEFRVITTNGNADEGACASSPAMLPMAAGPDPRVVTVHATQMRRFLTWGMRFGQSPEAISNSFVQSFVLVSILHALLLISTMYLPKVLPKAVVESAPAR